MTVVNPKSISGITSITTASGSDNLLTIHTSDANNTERLRIDSTGTTKIVTGIVTTLTATGSAKVGSGVTLSPDGDIFATGVTTSTTVQVGSATTIHTTGIDLGNGNLTGHNLHSTGITTSSSVVVGGGVTISESGIEASGIGITVANINGTQIGGRRNVVINGAMEVSQRGTSFTATGDEYTIDRFQHRIGTSYNFDTTTTQSTDHPNGFKNSLKISPDSVVTPSGSENGTISMSLEGQDVQQFAHGTSSAKPMTVSFYAKSGVSTANSGHVYAIQVRKFDSGGNRKYVLRPFTVTDSWQRFSFTFIGDTATAIRDTTDVGIEMVWQLSCGPDDLVSETGTWTSSTKFQGVSGQDNFMDDIYNQFYLTGVQLEVGSQATDFEHRSYGEEFRLCQRYYQEVLFNEQNTGGGILRASNSNNFQQPASIQQFGYMRAAASGAVISSNSLVYCRRLNGSSSDITASVSHAGGTAHGFINIRLTGTSSGTFTNEEPYVWWCRESDGQIMFSQDAEL